MAIRQALERVCVRQAALVTDKSDLASLLRLIVKQKEAVAAGEFEEFHADDEALRQTIADIAGHPNSWRVVKREKAQVDRFRLLTLPLPNCATHVIAEHETIVDAIAEHDPSAAEAAMQAHLEAVLPVFDEVRKAHPDFFESEPHYPDTAIQTRRSSAEGYVETALPSGVTAPSQCRAIGPFA